MSSPRGRHGALLPISPPVSGLDATRTPPTLSERLPARAVARILGVKVGTLAKWRRLGKGPMGWLRVSQTLVVYEIAEVERFVCERQLKGLKPGRAAAVLI